MSARFVIAAVVFSLLPAFSQLSDPKTKGLNLLGTLELVDKPTHATPVEALIVLIHELHGGDQFAAGPDRTGRFTLTNVRPGRYILKLTFPGRIQTFAIGSKPLKPDDFELMAGENGPLRIVVSLKTSVLSVDVTGIPDDHKDIVALLSPADDYLTLRESGILNPVSSRHTEFQYATPGNYLLFVMDSQFRMAVISSAAVRNRLINKATVVHVRGDHETSVSARYVTPDAVKEAISRAALSK